MLWIRSLCASQCCWRSAFLVLLLVATASGSMIDLGEFADQIRQHERVRIVRIEEIAALLGEIGFVRFLVDREEELLLEREELFLARVLVERELGFVDGAALFRDLPSCAAAACCAAGRASP